MTDSASCEIAPQHRGYGVPRWSSVEVTGHVYQRALVRTPWLGPDDDLTVVVRSAIGDVVEPGDTVFVSEKVAVLLTGRAVPASNVRVGRLARLLSGRVRPVGNSRGLSIPEKVQYVLDHAGTLRVLAAAAAALVTRPFGLRGAFFVVAGSLSRDLDGMRPPYQELLLPPLTLKDAARLAGELARAVGTAVAIVDINDRGGSVRAVSPGALPAAALFTVLADNPLGQRDQATPVGLVRPLPR